VTILGAVMMGALVFVVPGNLPSPAGSTGLALRTQPGPFMPFTFGCPAVLLAPVIVAREGDAMVFVSQSTGRPVDIAWPSGWTARVTNGRAELVEPFGRVFARERDVIGNTLTGGTSEDGTFRVCRTEPIPRPNIPTQGPPAPI
jgi:hypothetical protein